MGQNKSTPASAYQNAKNLFQARVSEKVGAELSKRVNSWLDRNDSFVSSFQSRYKSRSNSYRADAGSWYDSMSAQKTQSDTDAEEIRSMIRQYGSYLDRDWVSQVHDVLDRGTDVQSQMISAALEDRDYWAQFGDEDTYNRWHTANMAAQDILNAADFEQYSQAGAAIRNPAPEDVADRGLIIGGKLIFGTKGQDVGNVVTMSREHADLLAMAEANGGGGYEHGLKSIYRHMTDDEVAVYNYYLGKGYESMADRYLESLEEELTRREAGGLIQRVQGNAFNESLLMAGEGLENFRAGVRDYFGSIADKATGREEATITPITPTQHAAAGIKENTKGVKRAAYDLISTTTNMLPSILASTAVGLINPVAGVTVGNALMGTSSAGNAYAEMRRLGYDADQAGLYGVLVGSSEIGLNYVLGGISKLGGKVSGNAIAKAVEQVDHALARFAIEYGGRMASEGIEEGLQSALEPIFKGIVTGEFEGIDVGEVAYSALLGALSAGLLEGPSAIGSTVGQVRDTKSLYTKEAPEGASRMELMKETLKNGRLDTEAVAALGAESLELDPESRAGKRIQARLDKGKRVSGLTLDAAVRHNQRLMRDQSRDGGADPDADPGQTAAGAVGTAESGGTGNGDTLHGRLVTGQNEGISEGSEVPDELKTVSKKYGGQAGAMMAAYKAEQDITEYDEAFGAAFEMGQAGVSEAYVDRSPLTAYLDPAQRSLARAAGVASQADAAKAKAEANAARVKAGERLGTEAKAPRRGVLKSRGVSLQELQSQFNDTQRTAYKLLSGIAEATGIDIVFYRSEPDKAGFYTDAQGYFKREDNAIYLDVNAGINHARNVEDLSRYTVMRTFSHELTHFTEEWEPEAYNDLRAAVMAAMEGNGADVNALIEAHLEEGMTYEAASREVVAEAMTDILSDERSTFLTSLAEQNQTVFQKLKAKFQAFLAKIKDHFASLTENTSPEARAVKEQVGGVVRYMEDVVKAFDTAALRAVENYRAAEAAPSGAEIQLRETAETAGLSGTETEQMVESYGEGTHQEADDYARAFAEGVAYGKQNRNPADIAKDSLLGSMNPFDRQKALEAGRMAAIAEEDRREAEAIRRKAPPRSADKQGKKNYVTLELTDGKRMRNRSPRDQATYYAAKVLGEALQTDIVLHSTMGTTESGEKVNGKYDAATNTLHIALDAGMDGRRTSLFTLSHEVTHHVRQWSPRKYQALSDFVGEHISGDMGALIEEKKALLQKQEDYQDMTDTALTEAAHEEVVADAMETVLSDGNVLEDLATYDKSLWERVKAWVTDAIRKVREVYRGLAPNSRAAQALTETVSSMDEIERLFAEGVREAGVRVRSAGVEKPNDMTGNHPKYDIVVLDDGRMYVKASRKVIHGTGVDNWRGQITRFFKELLDENKKLDVPTLEGDVLTLTMDQTEYKARDNYKQVDKNRVPLTEGEFLVKLHAESHIDELAEIAKKESQGVIKDQKNHTFAKDGFTYRTAYFQDFDGRYYKIEFSIGHNANVATVYNVGKIKEDILPSAKIIAGVGSKGPWSTSSEHSIAQNSDSVKMKKTTSRATAPKTTPEDRPGPQISEVPENAFDAAVRRMNERMAKEAAERATHDPGTQQQRRTKDLSVREAGARVRSATVASENKEKGTEIQKYSVEYEETKANSDIIAMVEKIQSGDFKDNEKVPLGTVPTEIVNKLYEITGIHVDGFKMAMEARQLEHILKDHGENGRSDRSMANPADIAKMGYILYKPDDIRPAGRTQAYSSMVNGRNRTADTVLYEKNIGDKSYYVVQAVPNTKAKTLYVVTAFIGKEGYKKEAPQLINVEHLDATPDNGSANTSVNSIAQNPASVNRKNSISQKTAADGRTKSPEVPENAFDAAVRRMNERMAKEAAEKATLDPDTQQQRRTKDLSVRDVIAVGTESLRQAGALSSAEREALHGHEELMGRLFDLQAERRELGQLYHKQQFGDQPDRAEAQKTLNRMRIMDSKIARAEKEAREWEETKTMQGIVGKAQAIVDEMEQKNAAYVARRIENYRKREEIKKYKDRIKTDADELTKWILHPSQKEDHKHVPDALKDQVIPFLSSLDFSSRQKLSGRGTTKADVRFADQLRKLGETLQALDRDQVGENGGMSDLHPDFEGDFRALLGKVEELLAELDREKKPEYLINRMTAAELKELSRTVSRLRSFVVNYNKLYSNARYRHVYEAGDATISALQVMKSNDGRANGASNFLLWQQMRPELVFERFGEGGRAMNRELRAGQAKLARNAKAIVDFAEATYSAKEVKAWEDQVVTVKLGQGERDMTVAQLMTLYKLAGQEDSKRHLLSPSGGFRAAGFKKRGQRASDRVLPLSEADLEVIASALTERQREVADKLQVFMEKTGGGWGNEITQARFGEDLFTIRHYFPIHVDSRALGSKADSDKLESGGLYALLNKSFTKERDQRAGKPLVIHSIFDVFATHMSDMAQYNALALPVLDTIKWLNYKQNADWVDDGPDYESGIRTSDTVSVRDQMTRVYGAPVERGGKSSTGYAVSFVENIIKALSGTEAQGSVYDNVGLKALRLHNRAQVAYNLRVVAQQPFAILRAGMVLDPTDILRGMKPGAKVMKQNVAEMREHSGIALWKSLGFYDVNISRGMGDIIKHKASVIDKFQDAGMAGAEFMDTATWAAIWSACKARVKKQGIKPSDGRFFPAVTELFEDVIYRTQVVDSVLTKNEFMRSKGFFARSVSSFMGEPTTSAGMLLNTYDEIHRDKLSRRTGKESFKKHAKLVGRTAMVWGAQAVVMAAVTAAIDGLRDDDEYEKYGEKWLEAFGGNLFDEAMPFGKLPIVSDVYDLSKELYATVTGSEDVYGNPPQSVYMQWWDSLVKGAEITMDRIKGEDTNYTWYAGIYKLLQAASGMAGVSAGPIVREVVTTYNNLIVPAWNEVIARSAPSLRLETVRTYDPGDEADIRNAYRDGYLTEEEAVSHLLEKGLAEDEYDAHFTVRGWSEVDYSRFGALDEAVRWGGDITEASAELLDHGYTEKDVVGHIRGQIGKWYREGEIDRVQAQSLLEKYGDLDGDTIEAMLAEWSCVVETGTAYGDIKEAYLAGEITRGEAMEMYIRYGGKTEEEAEEKLVVIDFVEEHPACEGISYPAVTAYEELCEPCGISTEVFMEALAFRGSVEGDKDRNGKTISGTKKAKVLDYVDGLDLTRRQKKALGKALGYSD